MGRFARGLRCTFCAADYPLEGMWSGCPACQRADFVYPVEVVYDEAAQAEAAVRLGRTGQLAPGSSMVCVMTASGLKGPDTAAAGLPEMPVVEPDFDAFERAVREAYPARLSLFDTPQQAGLG